MPGTFPVDCSGPQGELSTLVTSDGSASELLSRRQACTVQCCRALSLLESIQDVCLLIVDDETRGVADTWVTGKVLAFQNDRLKL